MALEIYRKKRKFEETPEPAGRLRKPRAHKLLFVVQKHDATALHYDFRLEIDGVLKSWAVPKGPSLNPADKRLAMMTEDHPMDYAKFEGVIPEGHYGAGPVIVWDTGTFEIVGEMSGMEQLERGELKFELHGKKLHGGFVLIHTGKRATDTAGKKRWLLIKHRDEFATASNGVTNQERSVISGLTIEQMAEGAQPRTVRNKK